MRFFLALSCSLLFITPAIADEVVGLGDLQDLYSIDSTTGQAQLVGAMAFSDPAEVRMSTIVKNGSGELFAISTGQTNPSIVMNVPSRFYSVDEQTAATTLISTLPASNGVAAAFDPTDGTLFITNIGGPLTPFGAPSSLVQIDPSSGTILTTVALPLVTGPFLGLAFDDIGHLYSIQANTNTLWLIDKIDPVGGTSTPLPNMLPATLDMTQGGSLTRTKGGLFLGYERANGTLFTVDPGTGLGAVVSNVAGGVPFASIAGVGCAGSTKSYGSGCGGSGGFIPSISLDGCPEAQGGVTLMIDQGLGGATALVFLGGAQASIPVGFGCQLNVTQLVPSVAAISLGGSGFGQGAINIPFLIPTSASGATIHMQTFVIDPASPLGASSSPGLTVSID